MSRGKNRTKAEKRRRQTQDKDFENVVQDTAARFSCSTEIADDFASQCQHRSEDLDFDVIFARLAQEIWQDKSQGPLLAALSDLIAETQRHRDALLDLSRRFEILAAEQAHLHLDPPQALRPLIRQRLFPKSSQLPS